MVCAAVNSAVAVSSPAAQKGVSVERPAAAAEIESGRHVRASPLPTRPDARVKGAGQRFCGAL